jgi:hypothetical protein
MLRLQITVSFTCLRGTPAGELQSRHEPGQYYQGRVKKPDRGAERYLRPDRACTSYRARTSYADRTDIFNATAKTNC